MADQRYLVAARKYRPQLFHELVAQEHVTETLQNAIRLDRLAHAYLFSGPRGVGKTTAARILAKAINCTTPPEERPDGAEPCRTCDSCRSFEEGRSLNIIEIDAASNNKVEDIRELRDTVRIPPQGSRKKVYIVDEVHMLSNAAFNALLKTLEEPPPYVLFIFATTEPNKVLPTILSRCQRFDFRRIPVPDIVGHLREICEAEGITADDDALMLIARKGDGALRDALSAFDQAVSLCGTDLHYDELARALGVVGVDLFFEVTTHVHAHASAGMLRLVDTLVRSGHDLEEFLSGLGEHLRNVLVAVTMGDTELIEATEAVRARYATLAEPFAEPDVLRLLLIADETMQQIKSSPQPRLKLEMALLKMATVGRTTDLRDALQKLEALEQRINSGELPVVAASAEDAAAAEATTAPKRAATSEPAATKASTNEPATAYEPGPEYLPADPGTSPSPAPQMPPAMPPEVEPARQPATTPAPTEEPEIQPTPDAPEPKTPEPEPEPDTEPTSPEPDTEPARPGTEPEREPDTEPPSEPDTEPHPPEPDTEPRSEDAGPAASPADTADPTAVPGYLSLFGRPALGNKRKPGRDAAGGDSDAAASASTLVAEVAVPTVPNPELTLLQQHWAAFVVAVKADRIHVGSLLDAAEPLSVQQQIARVRVPDEFHQRLLGQQEPFLLEHLRAQMPTSIEQLEFIVDTGSASEAPEETGPAHDPLDVLQRKRQDDPVVAAIFEQFGGEIVW